MIAQTATKIRVQMEHFSGNLSKGLCKTARRFVAEAIYGIQARQSVHLTEISRSLEESIPLIKTENRLSRNLAKPQIRPVLQSALLREGSRRIGRDTLLILDLSDVVKPYAEKMQFLARVRDGSTGELANGYWLCQVIGVECEGNEIVPLYGQLYSQRATDFVSENEEILTAFRLVSKAAKKRGVWVLDRGGDRRDLYKELVPKSKGLRFLIRQKGDRHLLCGRRKMPTEEMARFCPLPYQDTMVHEEKGQERVRHLMYGFQAVRLPEHPEVPLWLVVVRGLGKKPLMLLTNVPMRKNRKVLWWAVSSYLTRWRAEETIRFGKQSYQIEDVRVMSYERLRNMFCLVMAAMFFTSVVLGTKMKLSILVSHVFKAAKRLFGIPDFRYYALSDGLKAVLTRFPRRSPPPGTGKSHPDQFLLFGT